MGYIHYNCLKQCIKTRLIKKESENYICYILKNYECEICLKEYPKFIRCKNTIYNLIDYSIPYSEFIIMDYILYDDVKKKILRKGIIIINIKDDQMISAGRSQNNIIKLKDISVSRTHCIFYKKENKIFIMDKGSKFGTLLYLKVPFTLCLENEKDILIQNLNKPTENGDKINNYVKMNLFVKNTIFQPSCINKSIIVENPCFNNKYKNLNIEYISNLFANQVKLIGGKNFFNIKMNKTWSFIPDIISKSLCCSYKNNNDDEFIIDLENDYKLKDAVSLITHNNIPFNNSNVIRTVNDNTSKNIDDSYLDYYLNIDTIIRQTENNSVEENEEVNENISFI